MFQFTNVTALIASMIISVSLHCYADEWIMEPRHELMWEENYTRIWSMNSAHETSDGGFLVTGRTWDPAAWVAKLNGYGSIVWQKSIPANNFEDVSSVPTLDGGFIVGGTAGARDFLLLKFKSNGSIAWQKYYRGNSYQYLYGIAEALDGSYIAFGFVYDDSNLENNLLVKLDVDGSPIWSKIYGNDPFKIGHICPTADGGYAALGSTNVRYIRSGDIGDDVVVLKLDADGDITWQKTYGGPADDGIFGYRPGTTGGSIGRILQTADGGYILSGTTESFGAGGRDMWVVKLDADGTPEWQKALGYDAEGEKEEYGGYVIQTSDGGYLLTGQRYLYIKSIFAYMPDVLLVKLDALGRITWQKNNIFGFGANSVSEISTGGYLVSLFDDCFPGECETGYVGKLNENGVVPSCPFSNANLTSTITHAVVQDINFTAQDYSVGVANSDATIENNAYQSNFLCYFSDSTYRQLNITGASVPAADARKNNLYDGSLNTYWVNSDGLNSHAWFEVSLDGASDIGFIKLATRPDLVYKFNVYVDGSMVGTYTKRTGASVALQTFQLPAGTYGQTVRVECTNQRWFRVQEIELWGGEVTSTMPVADADGPYEVTDSDNSGKEDVTLDGSGSTDRDGSIDSYDWYGGSRWLGDGEMLTVPFDVGEYDVELMVTDNDGNTDKDLTRVTVKEGVGGVFDSQLNIVSANVPVAAARKEYLHDSSLNTYWVNSDGLNSHAWFDLTLDSSSDIGCIKLATRPDLVYKFKVYVNGTFVGDYTKTTSASVALQTFALPAGTYGRYIRIQCTNQKWFRVQEVEVFGAIN
jgi:hypothetical protein